MANPFLLFYVTFINFDGTFDLFDLQVVIFRSYFINGALKHHAYRNRGKFTFFFRMHRHKNSRNRLWIYPYFDKHDGMSAPLRGQKGQKCRRHL